VSDLVGDCEAYEAYEPDKGTTSKSLLDVAGNKTGLPDAAAVCTLLTYVGSGRKVAVRRASARFRVVPNDARLVPFLTPFAKAATTMHVPETANVWSPLFLNADNVPEACTNFEPESITDHSYGTRLAFGHHYSRLSQNESFPKSELYWSTGK
jgi:hypothetical protein